MRRCGYEEMSWSNCDECNHRDCCDLYEDDDGILLFAIALLLGHLAWLAFVIAEMR